MEIRRNNLSKELQNTLNDLESEQSSILEEQISIKGEQGNIKNRLSALEEGSGSVVADVSGLNREVAYLKLKQAAADRIEGGVTFADDMKGSRFGFTLNEVESTNIKVRNGKMLMLKNEVVNHTATNATVASSAYSTAGNGGRKLVRLDNGWLISAVNQNQLSINLYISKDNGLTWSVLKYITLNTVNSIGDCALSVSGTKVYVLIAYTGSSVSNNDHKVLFVKIDTLVVSPTNDFNATYVDAGQNTVGNVSLAIDPTNGHLHAGWVSKNPTYPNSFNIRYAKSTDGGVTWSAPEQLTTRNAAGAYDYATLTLVLRNGNPIIIHSNKAPTSTGMIALRYSDGNWSSVDVFFLAGAYTQFNPSAVVDKDGVIHVAWVGRDATTYNTNNISYSKSVDGGVTWSAMSKLTTSTSTSFTMPSITVDNQNKLMVVFYGSDTLRYRKEFNNIQWSETVAVGAGTYPSVLYDPYFSCRFGEVPPNIYVSNSTVNFGGDWSETVEVPQTSATAVYDIPSTKYVGAFVQKAGAITVSATMNDTTVPTTLEGNEYELVKSFATEAPVKLKLTLSRTDTTGGENDAITRILGGRS